jgi:thiol-disulfide isomerase/thioredoxin
MTIGKGLMAIGLILGIGCAGPRAQTILSLQDISCRSCGGQSIKALKAAGGVDQVLFDHNKVELAITYDSKAHSPESLKKVITGLGYGVAIGAGQGRYEETTEASGTADVQSLTAVDETFQLSSLIVPGKVTVIDFFAVWCGPCREVDRAMNQIVSKAEDVAYRRIDIGQWGSAIATRFLGSAPELPYVVIYGKKGRELTRISGLDLVKLRRTIAGARAE